MKCWIIRLTPLLRISDEERKFKFLFSHFFVVPQKVLCLHGLCYILSRSVKVWRNCFVSL